MAAEHRIAFARLAALLLALVSGCSLAPHYARPALAVPDAYGETGLWRQARPGDREDRGPWWELFHDQGLDDLEAQVEGANQSVAAALANFHAARAVVKQARAGFFPLLTADPAASLGLQRPLPSPGDPSPAAVTQSQYSLPFDVAWEPDLWGRVANSVQASGYEAQAAAGDLDNVRLSVHAEVAEDYFQLRGLDVQQGLLDGQVSAAREAWDLARKQATSGLASGQDVSQARLLLDQAQAQGTDLSLQRALLEHALAALLGQPAASYPLLSGSAQIRPESPPAGVPSQLLERRPDVAAAERRVAEANAQIGVARAAYFPALSLDGSAGFMSSALGTLLSGPSFVWSVGGDLAQTLFDGGKHAAVTDQAWAVYQGTVANYRQTVLGAFQEVEDGLASTRLLTKELEQQRGATKASLALLDMAKARYQAGLDPYAAVIAARSNWLASRRTDTILESQQMTASVQLIKALGGGWNPASETAPAGP
jgi:NodT family efflux transporter outer membrane factor (OMF) lipoprotein